MSDISNSITNKIYNRLEHIVDNNYRAKGISSENIKKYFLIKRNFNNLLKNMSDLESVYNNSNHEIDFRDKVKDILFKIIIQDRIYFEKDNMQNEKLIQKFSDFIN
jgi:hypothetical protein